MSSTSSFSISAPPQHPKFSPSSLALPKCILPKLSVGQQYPVNPLQPECFAHAALSILASTPSAALFLAVASASSLSASSLIFAASAFFCCYNLLFRVLFQLGC